MTDLEQICRTGIPGYDPWRDAGDCVFDLDEAQTRVEFIESLELWEGVPPGTKFALQPWSMAFIGNLFGWRRPDGLRRYREALLYVPRKNAKSPIGAGIALSVGFQDEEEGMQIYSAASDREQAALIYRHASEMALRDSQLSAYVQVYKSTKSIEWKDKRRVLYKALSADAGTKHGLNVHCAIVDEVHAHPNSELIDVLSTGTASRRQPLLVYITTADYEREGSVCNAIYDRAVRVRDGVSTDPAFLPCIWEIPSDIDRTDPTYWTTDEAWRRANPNLGVSVQWDYLRRECEKAKADPSYENTFKRLHLNIRTQQSERVIQMDRWAECEAAFNESDIPKGAAVWLGLDLAQKHDIAAVGLLWRHDAGYRCRHRYYVPADTAHERDRKENIPYTRWARDKWLTLTPGNSIDYGYIIRDIVALCEAHDVAQIAVDPWDSRHVATILMEEHGLPVVEFRQVYSTMNEPTKELLRLIATRQLQHSGDPVLSWMASNMAVKRDPSDKIRPDKKASHEKIDGIVALIMAIGMAQTTFEKKSVYETSGVLYI